MKALSGKPRISILKYSLPILLSVLLISTPQQSVEAKKWRDVDLSEAPLIFKNWPNTEDCRFRQRMAANFSVETTFVECPKIPVYPIKENTVVRVTELMPGYYWSGAGGKDIREARIFKYGRFSGAKFDPGQEFVCDTDSSCAWRKITFKVNDGPCQLVHIVPGVGGQSDFWGQIDSKLSLLLIHCGTDKPITRENIVYTEDEKIKLIHPGGNQSVNKPKVASVPEKSEITSDGNGDIADRLKALKKLEDAGLISKEEAAAKRKEILKNL